MSTIKLNNAFPALEDLCRRMGADPNRSNWQQPDPVVSAALQKLWKELKEGKEVPLEEVKHGPGGLLSYKGEQVLLYIKDSGFDKYTLENAPAKANRFHVAECATLEIMRSAGRFERYVITQRTNGEFPVHYYDYDRREKRETEAALKVCMNCLRTLNYNGYSELNPENMDVDLCLRTLIYNGYSERKWVFTDLQGSLRTLNYNEYSEQQAKRHVIWWNFSIPEFFQHYATFFRTLPRRSDTALPESYVRDWARISRGAREGANWCCTKCGVRANQHKRLLHCHHKNGAVSDNAPANLEVLCALCHSEQPYHRPGVSPGVRATLAALRKAQGIAQPQAELEPA